MNPHDTWRRRRYPRNYPRLTLDFLYLGFRFFSRLNPIPRWSDFFESWPFFLKVEESLKPLWCGAMMWLQAQLTRGAHCSRRTRRWWRSFFWRRTEDFFKVVVVGEDNWGNGVMVLDVWWKGLRLFGKLIWPYWVCTVPARWTLISHVTFDLLLNCLLAFLSHIVPPWGRSCPSVAPVVSFLLLCVKYGKFWAASWLLCRFVQRGRGHKLTSWMMKLTLDCDACSRFLNDPILTGCASVLPLIASHLAASGTILGWGSLRGACALVLLKSSCLQERAELRHKKIGTQKVPYWKKTCYYSGWCLLMRVAGEHR